MSELRFSIVTCFYNSARRLERYLQALRRLDLQGEDVEFVFVDNASRDDTMECLRSASGSLPARVTLLTEPNPGLMHARSSGVAAAQGEFVLFLDDDNEPEPDYLKELSRLVDQYRDAVLFTGNCVLPEEYPAELGNAGVLPLLVIRELKGEFSFQLDTLVPPHIPWGAGLFARRSELVTACAAWSRGDVGITGRRGEQLSGGEDIWLAHYLTRTGTPVVFSDRLRITHRLDRDRFQAGYLARLGLENGLGHLALVEAVLEVKPQLRHSRLGGGHVLKVCLVVLPVRILLFLLRRDIATLTAAASQLGYTYSLLCRVAR